MSKLATVSLGQADHPGVHNTERNHINARRTALPGDNLQTMIDQLMSEGGGTLYLAAGTHTTPPLVLPRNPSTSDISSVKLKGEGYDTLLIGDAQSFESGDALISWQVATARAFQQSISNMTLQLPNVDGVKAIHYLPTSKADYNAHNAERLQIHLENLRIVGSNQYHPVFIHLEGTINRSIIRNIEGDPGQNEIQYETLLLQTDSDISGSKGNDMVGLLFSTIDGLWSSAVRGGHSRLFEGRINKSLFQHATCDGGLEASFHFINCAQSDIVRLATEGRSEQPAQYIFEGCEFLTVQNISIGNPNEVFEGAGFGDGMQLIDTNYCKFDSRWIASGVAVYSSATGNTKKLLAVDSDSSNNVFTRFGVRVGNGGLSAEIEDNGTDNVIEAVEF